jgi:glycosyltransferase involved in cell wall biosynthesis
MRPIIHVVQHLAPGGLEVMALELARAQSVHRETLVVSLEGEPEAAIAAWPRLAAQRERLLFMGKRAGRDPLLPARLARLFARLRPAAVHTHHVGPLLYAGPAARLTGARRVHTEHDAWHLGERRRRRLMRAAIALSRPVIVADAPHVAAALSKALGLPLPAVVLNGVDTERFAPRDQAAARHALGLPLEARIVGIAARLETVKGVDVAIAAASRLPGVVLAIAGRGSQEAVLRAEAAARGLADRVRFLGLVEDMPGFYAACDLACLPSREEGLPLAALEAQACGVPLVASAVGGVAAAADPASALLVAPESPDALARAIAERLAAPAGDSRAFVLREASLAATARAYLDLCVGE